MPEEEAAAPESGNAQPETMESAYESALATLEQGNAQPEEQAEANAPEEPGNAEEPEESEHIKWVKSVDGNFDRDKGEIIVDRLAKQAFELNKQNQTVTQRLNQLDALLKHPEVANALGRITGAIPREEKAAPQKPEEEKTDEQILDEWVKERIRNEMQPLVTENRVLFQEFARNQTETAYSKLKEEFGADDKGVPLYDSVKDQIGSQIAQAAAQNNMPVQQLVDTMIRRGVLYQTLSSMARNLLYPRLTERLKQNQVRTVQEKKRVNLTSRGTAAQSVKPAKREIKNILDAYAEAEEQNPEFKQLA